MSEPSCSVSRTFRPSFTRDERIADATRTPISRWSSSASPAEVRGAAGDDDLADAQRAGLVLVELERGDELPREGLQLAADRLAGGASACSCVRPSRDVAPRLERERALDRLGLRGREVERAGDRDVERSARPSRARA